ncbi:response regulator [Sphaerobacter thermophilus]|jgi:CheY-like chemotaxis protein|uniref:response regulator n=1 Tax=Sphaerobacter thermophilus TaxID=2057 RepID=UPI001FE12207|nr:response regulator [Sphaerobacter thermophilus]
MLERDPAGSEGGHVARILIVDDDPAIRTLLDELLREEGYSTVLACDGQSAIEQARATQPHLILMDLMLPVLDGATAIRVLKSDPRTNQIRIIAMSAGHNLRLQADDLPADGVLSKPFDLDALLAHVAVYTRHVANHEQSEVAGA